MQGHQVTFKPSTWGLYIVQCHVPLCRLDAYPVGYWGTVTGGKPATTAGYAPRGHL